MTLKPFVINQTDIQFILDQLNFLPLFDQFGNAIINWDGAGTVYNSAHAAYPTLASADLNIAAYGTSYQSVTDLAGLRDVSGLNNNLSLVNADWGAVDEIFTRSAAADYAHYSPIMQAVADYAYAAAKQYYSSYTSSAVGTVSPGTFNAGGTLNTDYTISPGGAQTAIDGTSITIKNVVDYTPRMISLATTTAGVTYDTWANHQLLIDGVTPNPDAAHHVANEIYYDQNGVASVLDWGQLATVASGGLGQVDTQARLVASAGQDDNFIGGLNPGVSPSNGFFVLFGQFFDHGLDFIGKASGQTIKIALATDDPLYGMLGPDGRPVHEITISRATVATVDANGPEYVNHTSPFIDQSQTYGSHAQLTSLLREWVLDPSTGQYHAGMNLFDGTTLGNAWTRADGTVTHDTLPTLDELRVHVEATGRDALTWEDVSDLRNRDASGHVVAGTSGSALLLDLNPRFDAGHMHGFYDTDGNGVQGVGEARFGTEAQSVKVDLAIATIDAAVKSMFGNASTFGIDPTTHKLTLYMEILPQGTPPGTPHMLDGANALYPFVNFADFSILGSLSGPLHAAIGEVLMASVGDHYIAGDGRVNENFGLTSIHHIFHEEHNYQIDNLIAALHREDIVSGDVTHAKLHAFQIDTGHGVNVAGDYLDASGNISWDQDKMFDGAKLIVEMEYQHAAVDQYARNVTPNIQEFVGYSSSVNSAVTLDYAQAAFRFGHSTLRETIDTIDPTHGLTGKIMGYALKEAFLAPEKFSDVGPGAVILGMSHQQMNEVDEFVTPALNQGLLGQPLDLAAINIARGRDIGLPTLNDFREAIGLARYSSWTDFGQNMQHPSSLVNFIAAYAFDGSMERAQAVLDLVDGTYADTAAGLSLGSVLGWAAEVTSGIGAVVAKAFAFLEGSDQSFNRIDTWLGGLAEIHQPGGLLGETFDKVFVSQIEALMDGDRFYYLFRLAGQQFAEEVGNGQLKDIVERNTGLTHMNGNIFGYADKYYDFGAQKEVSANGAETQTSSNNHKYGDVYDTDGVKLADGALTTHSTLGIYTNGGRSSALDGTVVTINNVDYIRDTRLEDTGAALLNDGVNLDGTPNSGAESSEVIVGTDRSDLVYAQGGDDTVYGDGGNDTIYGGFGIDRLYGGDGSDKIYGGDNPDLIDGGSGDDFLYGESSGSDINGNDQVIGGSGNDLISGGTGIDKLSGGTGDDRIYGDQDTDPFTHGSDGNDYVDGGTGGDILYGDNGDDVLVGGADQDQMFGGFGDDIIRPGDTTGALTIGTDEVLGGDGVADEGEQPGTIGFDLVDFSDNAVRPSGVTFNLADQQNPAVNVNGIPKQIAAFQVEGLIGSAGGDTLTGDSAGDAALANAALDRGENWLIGGSGADLFTGAGGNDIIVGGSIRLDTLIGKYNSGYTHNNNNTGITEADQLQDALYQGASHRALYSETIDNTGLIDAVNATIPGTANDFAKHFTELLRTEMFKDTMLGDGGVDAQTRTNADIAIYTGRFTDYKITAVPFNAGNADGNLVAYKIEDLRNPLAVDANGVVIPTDGTDLVVGVETLRFSDRDVSLLNTPPVLDLHAFTTTTGTVADNFNSATAGNSTGSAAWATPWTESGDLVTGNVVTGGQIQLDAGSGNNATGQLRLLDNGDGAVIQRSIDLSNAQSASLNFTANVNSLDSTDYVKVTFTADSTAAVPVFHDVKTITSTSNNNSVNGLNLIGLLSPGEVMTAHAAIKFEVISSATNTGNSANNGYVAIDNVSIAFTKQTAANDGTNNFTTTFTENGSRVAIAAGPSITDDGTTIASARATLAIVTPGDTLRVGNSNNTTGSVSGGISYTIATTGNVVTLSMSGVATLAQYQAAIEQIRFFTASDNPTSQDRIVNVTVNDGLIDSNLATATIHVTPVNDQPTANTDYVVTNVAANTGFAVPIWTFLANDTDPDGPLLTVVSTSANNGLTAALSPSQGTITLTDNATAGGTFTYTVNDGSGTGNATDTATANLSRVTGTTLEGATGNNLGRAEILIGGAGNDTITGHGGNDIILAGAGNDTINWYANNGNNNTPTDGHDFVDGGAGTIDSFVVTGRTNVAETFAIYSNTDDWDNNASNGIVTSAAHAGFTGLNANTEIVVARNGTIIAELDNIEEITINALNATANNNNNPSAPDGGTNGGDTIQVVGNFTATSLNYSTIHINGGAGNDTVDISKLASDHRIVFHGGAGNNQVVGNLRPQDVVDSVGGSTSGNGTSTPSNGTGGNAADDEENDETGNRRPVNSRPLTLQPTGSGTQLIITAAMLLANSHDCDGDTLTVSDLTASSGTIDQRDDGHWSFTPASDHLGVVSFNYGVSDGIHTVAQEAMLDLVAPTVPDSVNDTASGPAPTTAEASSGTDAADVMIGASGEDVLSGGTGDDVILGNDGNDTLMGGAGDDLIKGGEGHDVIFGGAGHDDLFGGAGNDMIFGDTGDDRIFGDAGNDVVEGDTGSDAVYGGGGDDRVVATLNDGDDVYWGEAGQDTLDYAAITASLTVDLGNGTLQHGSVTSTQSGNDTVFGFENVMTGSGDDTISASAVANIMDGGLGRDTFVFRSAQDANHDTINGFKPGDRIDLSGIDANEATAGHQSFVLFAGTSFTAAGQVMVNHEVRDGVDHTIISANTHGDTGPDFEIDVTGNHTIRASDFSGVN